MAFTAGLVVALSLVIIGLVPTGPDREAPPSPQPTGHFLRPDPTPVPSRSGAGSGPGALTVGPLDRPDPVGADEPVGPARPAIDPLTFLPPFADSVLFDDLGWICETPAPPDALHVAPAGDDDAPGTVERPLASIDEAMDRARPGQHVLVRGGRYDEAVVVEVSGRPDAWITLRSYPGERASIAPPIGQNAVAYRRGASYHNIACLELAGPIEQPDAVPASPGVLRERRLAGDGPDEIPQNYGAGVDIGDRAETRDGFLSHHVRVLANEVHHFAEMGISAVEASHVTISGNVVHGNALYGCHSGSGIGLGYMIDTGGPPNPDGYTNYVVGNVSYGNENRSLQCFSEELGPVVTDGNGIIIDENDSTGYQGRTLVADNLVYGNGGRGILIYRSGGVDVVNNISYHNVWTDGLLGEDGPHPEVAVSDAADVHVYNNIAVPRPGHTAFAGGGSGVDVRANRFEEPGTADELFVAPGTSATADFTRRPDAASTLTNGIPFLMTVVDPDTGPVLLDPAEAGTVYTSGAVDGP